MKKLTILLAAVALCSAAKAQDKEKKDTIRIGNMVIVKDGDKGKHFNFRRRSHRRRNISTSWGVVDLGFSNYIDKTNYASTGGFLVDRPGYPALDKNDFKLRTGKSVNVNIWFFMQELNLVKHYVNLKYGLGFELNNYRYKSSISYKEGGPVPYSNPAAITNAPFIFRDSISFSKNKLAADYLTVPVMLFFKSNREDYDKGFSLGIGVSAGYLYSERNKQKSDRGKLKNKGDYDLERFKFSYQAELGLGPIHLYGSYSPNSFYQKGLDMHPYTIGFRLTN
jgi:hypothetical protein